MHSTDLEASSHFHRVEFIMGMPIGLDLRDADLDPAILDRVFSWLRQVDSTFSTYNENSEISRLNRHVLSVSQVAPDVREVLEFCEDLRQETDGYFDIRTDRLPVPITTAAGVTTRSGIDPSGLVKGWSIDRAATILDKAGSRNYSINAGGDIRMRGGALPDENWRVGIQHPLIPDKIAAVVAASDLAIATSGNYARGDHIVNPHTGVPPTGVLSVTVVGAELARADAYATAAYAMGESGPAWTPRLFGYEAMTILADERVLSTRWFPSI